MLSNTSAVLLALFIFGSVCGVVLADTDGPDDVPDEEEGYYYFYPETTNLTNILTEEDVQQMIDENRALTRRKILTDPELAVIIKHHVKVLLAKKRECVAKNLHYYDFEIPDCKSCLRSDCDIDETCRAECRGMLELKRQREDLDAGKNSSEQLRIKYEELELKQSQNEGNDNAWVVGIVTLVVFTAINTIVLIPLAVFVGIMWMRRKEPKHFVALKVADDEEVEMKELVTIENEEDRDSGTGSERVLAGDQNVAT